MKHFLLLLLIIVPFISSAQLLPTLDKKTGLITFSDEVNVRGVSETELYNRMKAFYLAGSSSDEPIILEDGAAGKMIGQAYTDIIVNDGKTTEKQRLWYTLLIELEDGKFSYVLKDFSMQRYCIPARPIACEEQTKPVALEDVFKPATKKAKSSSVKAYSLENQLSKAAASLVASLTKSALTDRNIAGISQK